jgi:hypothetical protein
MIRNCSGGIIQSSCKQIGQRGAVENRAGPDQNSKKFEIALSPVLHRLRGGLKAFLVTFIMFLLLVAGLIRPIEISEERGQSTLWLWAWQQGRIDFVNSITKRPVTIHFGMAWRFSGFFAQTDPGTEEYYTAGVYSWNEKLAKEQTRMIRYCSEVGVTLTIGGMVIHKRGGCISATLLWPPG